VTVLPCGVVGENCKRRRETGRRGESLPCSNAECPGPMYSASRSVQKVLESKHNFLPLDSTSARPSDMASRSVPMDGDDVWDDSALVRSWDDALAEYQVSPQGMPTHPAAAGPVRALRRATEISQHPRRKVVHERFEAGGSRSCPRVSGSIHPRIEPGHASILIMSPPVAATRRMPSLKRSRQSRSRTPSPTQGPAPTVPKQVQVSNPSPHVR